mmetsp:Transcript_25181/g.29144  ORF Transcript_25181/g.29144 Transcript_25181/m.29144 type:complete len:349 (+) Transcript_25181:33-1079(+)
MLNIVSPSRKNNSFHKQAKLFFSITTFFFFNTLILFTTQSHAIEIMNGSNQHNFIVATRIHLGKQSKPIPKSKLISTLSSFVQTATKIGACRAVIAIDPEEKIKGYDLVCELEDALKQVRKDGCYCKDKIVDCDFLKVSPWGAFVPALNALVSYACTTEILTKEEEEDSSLLFADSILFISAETTLMKESMDALCKHMNLDDTLVVGAALSGHDFHAGDGNGNGNETDERIVDLNGRTCPWNTLALWNLKKLKLGFSLVADGIHKTEDGSPVPAGIEEFSTVLLHQNLTNKETCKAKLVQIPGVEWEQTFDDEERRKWHEAKMKSKFTRAEIHRNSLDDSMKGCAIHI